MKLHFLSAHERVGPMRKTLGLADGSSRSYPLAGKVTSYEEDFDIASGVAAYRDLLAKHALRGHALYKGLFAKPLNNESRRGQTDKSSKTELLVLDIDGLSLDHITAKLGCRPKDVIEMAEGVISLLPKALHKVSYVALASSSFGLKDKQVSIHIHFLLEEPVSHRALKDWLLSLNYTQQSIFEKLELTNSKMKLKSVVDPCLAEPARIVYIAPPLFGPRIQNPFIDDSDRIVAVDKKVKLLDLNTEMDMLAKKRGIVDTRKMEALKDLQKKAGVSSAKLTYTNLNVDGYSLSVVSNPPEIELEFAYEDHEFVRYNVRGKSNNAFWVAKNNPEVVKCFIPDEPPFLFRKADPLTYKEHVAKYGEVFERSVNAETGKVQEIVRSMHQCRDTDNFITLEYDKKSGNIIEMKSHGGSDAPANWLKHYATPIPDPVPPVYVTMNPNRDDTLYTIDDKFYINRFVPTVYMDKNTEKPEVYQLKYGQAWLLHTDCPVISEIVLNMLGDDMDCFEHFVNWLAYIFQKRDKAETAWLVHGIEGTGKGVFFKRIVQPLFGKDYAVQNTLRGVADDQFNGWMEDVIFLMIDEFNMKGSASLNKTVSLLKNLVTEPTLMLRKMQQQQRSVVQRLNMLFATNDLDAMPAADRRRYNIAPRQQRAIEARLPCFEHREATDSIIENELSIFAAYLQEFQVNRSQVTKILVNQARIDLHEASMNSVDRFFESVIAGNFGYFIHIFDRNMQNLDPKELVQLNRAKSFMVACLPHVNTNEPCYIHFEDLRMLYSFLACKEISPNAFNKMKSAHEFETKRVSHAVGSTTKLATRPRCVEVRWKYGDTAIIDNIRAHNNALPTAMNTVSIKPAESADELRDRMLKQKQDKIRAEAEASLSEPDIHKNEGWD